MSSGRESEQGQLQVVQIDGSFVCEAYKDWTVAHLKTKIAETIGMSAPEQQILLNAKIVDAGDVLGEHCGEHGVVTLVRLNTWAILETHLWALIQKFASDKDNPSVICSIPLSFDADTEISLSLKSQVLQLENKTVERSDMKQVLDVVRGGIPLWLSVGGMYGGMEVHFKNDVLQAEASSRMSDGWNPTYVISIDGFEELSEEEARKRSAEEEEEEERDMTTLQFFPIEDLACRPPWPEGVDPTRREVWLSDVDFLQAFGMTKTDFASKPNWKQQQLKRDVQLF